MMKLTMGILVCVSILLAGVTDVVAKKVVVDLATDKLTTRTDQSSEIGNYYLLAVPVPAVAEGKRLLGAFLEFSVDASVVGPASGVDPAPQLQVFALTDSMGGAFNEALLKKGAGIVPVPVGSSRRVKVDVTDIVGGWLDTPSTNHGVAIGALIGAPDGRFTVSSGVLGMGVAARLVVHHESL